MAARRLTGSLLTAPLQSSIRPRLHQVAHSSLLSGIRHQAVVALLQVAVVREASELAVEGRRRREVDSRMPSQTI